MKEEPRKRKGRHGVERKRGKVEEQSRGREREESGSNLIYATEMVGPL